MPETNYETMFGMIGTSEPMLTVYDRIRRVADSISRTAQAGATVHISGERGTGKELVATALHSAGARKGPFIDVNAAEYKDDDTLLRADLFGIGNKVATGVESRPGYFEQATGGTLFIDEIAHMDPGIQALLLRVLQQREIARVGASRTARINLDAMIITAAQQPLEVYVANGSFREDLNDRLGTVRIQLPPLRERGGDIALLANHYLEVYNKRYGHDHRFSDRTYDWFLQQSWPGNVRELEKTIHGAVILSKNKELNPDDFPNRELPAENGPVKFSADSLYRPDGSLFTWPEVDKIGNTLKMKLYELALEETGTTVKAAKKLHTDRTAIYRNLRRAELSKLKETANGKSAN